MPRFNGHCSPNQNALCELYTREKESSASPSNPHIYNNSSLVVSPPPTATKTPLPSQLYIHTSSLLLPLPLKIPTTKRKENTKGKENSLISIRIRAPVLTHRAGMHQRAQRAPVDHQPGDEGAKLRGREEVDLEHGDGVWADGFVPDAVGAEFRDCGLREGGG